MRGLDRGLTGRRRWHEVRIGVIGRTAHRTLGGPLFRPCTLIEELAVERLPALGATLRVDRSEEHTSELQSLTNLVCRLLLEKKKKKKKHSTQTHKKQRQTTTKSNETTYT